MLVEKHTTPKRVKVAVWKTVDGRKVPVPRMLDSHLLNAHRYMRRKLLERAMMYGRMDEDNEPGLSLEDLFEIDQRGLKWIAIFSTEIKRRGLEILPLTEPDIEFRINVEGETNG